ncbi:amidase, partial [Methylobacterium sp. WL103]|uniref:amidase n=1 Tax=Methylobacterium sp. WL103 TaxID=2603891 RepID=UPI0011C9C9F1
PLGLGTDLAISVRGPAAQTGIVSLKGTHGRVPMTGIWPRAPRRFWHVGPMARSIRDLALAFSLLAGPDGEDGYASRFEAGAAPAPDRPLRVGWLVEPGFGPVDSEVAATVRAAAEALASLGHTVEAVRIPALERDFALDVFNKLHVMEMKPAFRAATAGHEDQMYTMARTMLSLPDTTMAEYVAAEQAAERLRDGYAAYFRDHDILLTPVLPVPAHKHGIKELVVDGKTVDLTYLQGATVPLNVTGLPGLSMRFGTSREGLPINVQVVGSWQAEGTILHAAALLEGVSPVRGLHPSL